VDRRAELPPGEPPTLPVPVFAHDGRLSVRYLRFYITKGHEVAGAPLTAADTELWNYMDDVMRRPNLPVTFGMERGDMQFVNNVFILHSRAEYKDHPEQERKRHYMRLWLKVPLVEQALACAFKTQAKACSTRLYRDFSYLSL